MRYTLPLCTKNDYVPYGDQFRLNGSYFLALPGCVTKKPEQGASLYNRNLIKHVKKCYRESSINIARKYPTNKRVVKVKNLMKSNEVDFTNLSRIEHVILLSILAENLI